MPANPGLLGSSLYQLAWTIFLIPHRTHPPVAPIDPIWLPTGIRRKSEKIDNNGAHSKGQRYDSFAKKHHPTITLLLEENARSVPCFAGLISRTLFLTVRSGSCQSYCQFLDHMVYFMGITKPFPCHIQDPVQTQVLPSPRQFASENGARFWGDSWI